jgi:uncharacterized repeat protein (TIGR03803 family)
MHNRFFRFWMTIVALALTGCAWQSVTPSTRQANAPSAINYSARDGGRFKIVYQFPGGAGGQNPGGLSFVNGVMFGITFFGGDAPKCPDCGTVFAGKDIIYSFEGIKRKDGSLPSSRLLPVGNELYGLTSAGGLNPTCHLGNGCGSGTVYAVDSGGNERVVHRFKYGGDDGVSPTGGLTSLNGILYGVTTFGGTGNRCHQGSYSPFPSGCGVVFAIDSSGREKVIHRFTDFPDGAWPGASLSALNGNLYGTTFFGGRAAATTHCDIRGCGTVFVVTPSGKESVIYSFRGGGYDGANPHSELVFYNGYLWGTTAAGGNGNFGTIFKISTSGRETLVYRFTGAPNGAQPGRLVVVGNKIYGTTSSGGNPQNTSGTIFSLTSKGVQILYRSSAEAGGPGGLVFDDVTEALYGTTNGGRHQAGTIFRYRP